MCQTRHVPSPKSSVWVCNCRVHAVRELRTCSRGPFRSECRMELVWNGPDLSVPFGGCMPDVPVQSPPLSESVSVGGSFHPLVSDRVHGTCHCSLPTPGGTGRHRPRAALALGLPPAVRGPAGCMRCTCSDRLSGEASAVDHRPGPLTKEPLHSPLPRPSFPHPQAARRRSSCTAGTSPTPPAAHSHLSMPMESLC